MRNTDLSASCLPGVCQHGGVCHDNLNSFYCDCNMTAYSGAACTEGQFRFDSIIASTKIGYVSASVCFLYWFVLSVLWTITRLGDRLFAVADSRVWNNLPTALRLVDAYIEGISVVEAAKRFLDATQAQLEVYTLV